MSANAENRSARLLGVGKNSVGCLVSEWSKAVHNMNGDDTSLRNVINCKSQPGCHTTQKKRVPDDDRRFHLIRDLLLKKELMEGEFERRIYCHYL